VAGQSDLERAVGLDGGEREHLGRHCRQVIATVEERIAADDAADVPALEGWRDRLFGEKALALKHSKLAVEKGCVVAVEKQ
jgi:hypothetical protein